MTATSDFFRTIYGGETLPGSIVIFALDPPTAKPVVSAWCDNIPQAATVAQKYADRANVYFNVCLQAGKQPSPFARGSEETVSALTELYMDVDFGDKGNGKKYPPTAEVAIELLDRMPLPPSLVVNSGGGFQVHYILREPWELGDADERHRAKSLSCAWTRLLQQKAKDRGYELDSTYDLARLLRPVGTLNHNYGEPRPVTIVAYHPDRLYIPDDFDAFDFPLETNGHNRHSVGSFVIPTGPLELKDLGERFGAVLANSDGADGVFKAVWTGSRKIGDGSASASTWAIGRRLKDVGATDQEIVSACMTWRYQHGANSDKHASHAWWEGEIQRIREKPDEKKLISAETEKPASQPFALPNGFTLLPVSARETASGKVVVKVKLIQDGQSLVLVEIPSSVSGQETAIKSLARYMQATHTEDITMTVGKIIVQAHDQLAAAKGEPKGEPAGLTVRDIVCREVLPKFRLAYATEKGAWSESRGREVQRSEFTAYTPASLVAECLTAIDAPRIEETGCVDETKLLRIIESSLKIVWATQIETLPRKAAEAELPEDSEDAKRFWAGVLRIWLSLTTFQIDRRKTETGPEETASRASLASRVRAELETPNLRRRPGWIRVQNGVDAFWRPHVGPDGEVLTLLAMRHTLADQLRVPLPGVTDQHSLRTLACHYGVTEDVPGVTDRLTGGARVIILSQRMTVEILAQPAEPISRPTGFDESDRSDSESGVTEKNLMAT